MEAEQGRGSGVGADRLGSTQPVVDCREEIHSLEPPVAEQLGIEGDRNQPAGLDFLLGGGPLEQADEVSRVAVCVGQCLSGIGCRAGGST